MYQNLIDPHLRGLDENIARTRLTDPFNIFEDALYPVHLEVTPPTLVCLSGILPHVL